MENIKMIECLTNALTHGMYTLGTYDSGSTNVLGVLRIKKKSSSIQKLLFIIVV